MSTTTRMRFLDPPQSLAARRRARDQGPEGAGGEHVITLPPGDYRYVEADDGSISIFRQRGGADARRPDEDEGNGDDNRERLARMTGGTSDRASVGSHAAVAGAGGGTGIRAAIKTPADINKRAAEIYSAGGDHG